MFHLSWGRWAAVGALVLLIAGVLVWMATQQSTASSTSRGLVGSPAPLSSLQLASSQGRPVSLGQFSGKKVVLFFYEGSTCGSCQQELSLIQGIVAKRHDTVAVGASVDPVSTSTNVASQLKLSYPILADVNHQLGLALTGRGTYTPQFLVRFNHWGSDKFAALTDRLGFVPEWAMGLGLLLLIGVMAAIAWPRERHQGPGEDQGHDSAWPVVVTAFENSEPLPACCPPKNAVPAVSET